MVQSPAETPVTVVPLALHMFDGEAVKVTDPVPAPPVVDNESALPTLTLCKAFTVSVG